MFDNSFLRQNAKERNWWPTRGTPLETVKEINWKECCSVWGSSFYSRRDLVEGGNLGVNSCIILCNHGYLCSFTNGLTVSVRVVFSF